MEYQINHTINDKTIHIHVIHNNSYYETNISNNDTNQNILKDNKFTYHHVGNKLIMINNDKLIIKIE